MPGIEYQVCTLVQVYIVLGVGIVFLFAKHGNNYGDIEMNITELFEQQIAGGATDNFFYGTEIDGTVRIERHRGPLETLSLDGLVFDRMMGSTPFFRPVNRDNVLTSEQSAKRRENRKEMRSKLGFSRVGLDNV